MPKNILKNLIITLLITFTLSIVFAQEESKPCKGLATNDAQQALLDSSCTWLQLEFQLKPPQPSYGFNDLNLGDNSEPSLDTFEDFILYYRNKLLPTDYGNILPQVFYLAQTCQNYPPHLSPDSKCVPRFISALNAAHYISPQKFDKESHKYFDASYFQETINQQEDLPNQIKRICPNLFNTYQTYAQATEYNFPLGLFFGYLLQSESIGTEPFSQNEMVETKTHNSNLLLIEACPVLHKSYQDILHLAEDNALTIILDFTIYANAYVEELSKFNDYPYILYYDYPSTIQLDYMPAQW